MSTRSWTACPNCSNTSRKRRMLPRDGGRIQRCASNRGTSKNQICRPSFEPGVPPISPSSMPKRMGRDRHTCCGLRKKNDGKDGAECAEDSRDKGDRENLGRRQLQGGVLDQRDIIHGRTLLAHLNKNGSEFNWDTSRMSTLLGREITQQEIEDALSE